MEGIALLVIIGLAVLFLIGFDRISGRGPGQVKDGINEARRDDEQRVPCPHCAEQILPAAKKCPHCRTEL